MKQINLKDLQEEQEVQKRLLEGDEVYFEYLKKAYIENNASLTPGERNFMEKLYQAELKKRNAQYFFAYMKQNGLSKEKNTSILEVTSARSVLNPYLLSEGFHTTVLTTDEQEYPSKKDMQNYMYGKLTMEGIERREEPPVTDLFSALFSNTIPVPEEAPDIYDFDTIICQEEYSQAPIIMSYPVDTYVGFCIENEDPEKVRKTIERYKKVVERLNHMYRDNYYLQQDSDQTIEREFGLIKRR